MDQVELSFRCAGNSNLHFAISEISVQMCGDVTANESQQ